MILVNSPSVMVIHALCWSILHLIILHVLHLVTLVVMPVLRLHLHGLTRTADIHVLPVHVVVSSWLLRRLWDARCLLLVFLFFSSRLKSKNLLVIDAVGRCFEKARLGLICAASTTKFAVVSIHDAVLDSAMEVDLVCATSYLSQNV